jgi:hypothetical protein
VVSDPSRDEAENEDVATRERRKSERYPMSTLPTIHRLTLRNGDLVVRQRMPVLPLNDLDTWKPVRKLSKVHAGDNDN